MAQAGVVFQDFAAKMSPTGVVPDRDVYYPGTEELKPDEMRITALGTGMPSARPKQAAACFLPPSMSRCGLFAEPSVSAT